MVYLNSAYSNLKRLRKLSASPRVLPDASKAISTHAADKIVLVIGESASAEQHSLYGYPLPTSPHLDAMRDSLFIFTDAICSSTATTVNLPRILSFLNDIHDSGEWQDYPTVIQLFKALGYHTVWLSNQERTGFWSNQSAIIADEADDTRFLGANDSEDNLLYTFDDVLIPPFREVLAPSGSRSLICIHLLGSHNAYNMRYPADFKRFNGADVLAKTPHRKWLNAEKAETVAAYDNSIAYTDSILSVIINDVGQRSEPALVIYFSDHGENLYDVADFAGRDRRRSRVPFFIYANSSYHARNPEILVSIRKALDLPITTAEFIHMLLTLTGSSYPLYNPAADPLSRDFRARTRYVDEDTWPIPAK